MPQPTNKLTQFWQELKRRKVVRVIAMYAASAFIILEAIDIIFPRMGLPEWTVTFIIVLIIIGFPITVILSWIFDITPEGVIKTESIEVAKEQELLLVPVKRRLKVSDLIIVVLVVVVVILAYPKIFNKDKFKNIRDADGRISITVLPFENLTGDSLYFDWQAGVQNLLINSLSNSKEISVRQLETMSNILSDTGNINYASITPSFASEIAQKLETNTFILGNILKAGNKIHITVQLRDASTREIYRSYKVDGDTIDQIFIMADSLSNLLMNFLEIKVLEEDAYFHAKKDSVTNSVEAYMYYIQGQKMSNSSEYTEAIKLYYKALDRDSSFVSALIWLTASYLNNGQPEQARLIQKRTARYIDQAPLYEQLFYNYFKALLDKDPQGRIKYAMRLTEEYPYAILPYNALGLSYYRIHQYEKASDAFEKRFELLKKMNFEEPWFPLYLEAGLCYHELGQHTKEQEVYELGLRVLPDHLYIIYRQAVCALSQGDTTGAQEYIAKYRSIREIKGHSEYSITFWIGMIYQEAEQLDKAMDIFRDLIAKDSQNPWSKWRLGFILIDNVINIDEGMKLIDQALEIEPDDVDLKYTKGLGYYRQGQLEEALGILKESWDQRLSYNHELYLNIQEVEKALADQNK